MPDSAVTVVARAINAAQLKWKAENGGDDASCYDMPDELLAQAAIDAYLKHVQDTLASVEVEVRDDVNG